MSRLRENPERLFEVFIEVAKPSEEKSDPFILQCYPPDFNDEEVLKSVPQFAFPCDTERYTTTVDHFTFTLTDLESKYKFGFCRHATGAQTCFCIVSFLPWFEIFYNLLNLLAEITNRSEDNDVTLMLRAAYAQEVPPPAMPVTVVSGHEMFSFKSPENNKLPSIPASRNLTEYYNAIDTNNMMMIFASMLHERRIIVTSKKLSRLTAVVHAAASLLYPMIWQHLYIPVLPTHLLDYLNAPMPFVIGVHTKLFERVKESELGDAVIVDADKNTVTTDFDDLEDLPDNISHHLKRHMKGEKVKNSMQGTGDVISRSFMLSLVKLIGGYRDALKFNEGETITFCPEAFVQSRHLSMQPFLENMLQLQIFQEFINDRLDMLNCGKGFTDIFEQECLLHADKMNAQSRYKDWLHNMKEQGKKVQKGSKDVWADIRDKVRKGGKSAVKNFRTKISDLKKEDSPVSLKPSKSVRQGPQTKTFSRDRPSTIVGQPLSTSRPPRPPPPSPGSEQTQPPMRPKISIQHAASDRVPRSLSGKEVLDRVSADDMDVLMYNRVSCNLMSDPDIQQAMFKSASAENLPKREPILQEMSSSDSLTSSSDSQADLPYIDDHPHGDSPRSAFQYGTLMDDEDSRVSQSKSQDQQSSSESRPVPPPRPSKPKDNVPDRLIHSSKAPPGPKAPPLPARRRSLDPKPLPSKPDIPADQLLINLESPERDLEVSAGQDSGQALAFLDESLVAQQQTTAVTPSGQNNRRASITRTPAMKMSANETPRVSIRRERSPITPDGSVNQNTNSISFFDPLFGQAQTTPVAADKSSVSGGDAGGSSANDSDSLLKSWDIHSLASGAPMGARQNFVQTDMSVPKPHSRQGQVPMGTPNAHTRQSPVPMRTPPPQVSPMGVPYAQTRQSPVSMRTPPSQSSPIRAPYANTGQSPVLMRSSFSPARTSPTPRGQQPPVPASRPVSNSPFLANQNKRSACFEPQFNKDPSKTTPSQDPFADLLVNLNPSPPSPTPPKSKWETFD